MGKGNSMKKEEVAKRAFPPYVSPGNYIDHPEDLKKNEEVMVQKCPDFRYVAKWTLLDGEYLTDGDPNEVGRNFGFEAKLPNICKRFGDLVIYGNIVDGSPVLFDVYDRGRGLYFDFDDAYHIIMRELRVEPPLGLVRYGWPGYLKWEDNWPDRILIRPTQDRFSKNGRVILFANAED